MFGLTLMPAKPGTCKACAVDHDPQLPHDAHSLHFQYWFYAQSGRWPTWEDAMDHCEEHVKDQVIEILKEAGQWTE